MGIESRNATAKGPGDWFTGDVYVDALAKGHGSPPMSIGSVHFSPGARTAWHSHSIGQTLIVTEGEGRFQSRGASVSPIQPGDVVSIDGGEWHWHGASVDRFMTHISITEGDTTWGDHVTGADDGSE